MRSEIHQDYLATEDSYRRSVALGNHADALVHINALIESHPFTFGLAELKAEKDRLKSLADAAKWEKNKTPFVQSLLRTFGLGPKAVRL